VVVHHPVDLQEAEDALEAVSFQLVWHDRLVSRGLLLSGVGADAC
jgi:hypothetical protein